MATRVIRMNVAALSLYSLFRGFSVSGYQVLFSAYMRSLGYSMTSIGGAVTVSSLAGALLAPGFGAVIECYGARLTTTLTGLMLVVSLLLLSIPEPGYAAFVASYVLYMLAFSLGQPARSTLLAKSVPGELHGYYTGVTMAVFATARIVGPLTAGWLAARAGYPQAFTVLTLSAAVGVTVFHILSMEPSEPACKNTLQKLRSAYTSALKPHKELRRLYPLLVVDRSGWSLWFPLLSAQLKAVGYTEDQIGALYTASSLLQATTSMVWGRLTDRLGPAKTVASSELLGAAALPLLANPHPWINAAAGMALIGLSIAAWVPAYNKLVAQLARGNLGEAYANANAVRSLAGTPTPTIGGIIYETLGPAALYTLSATLLTTSAAYALKTLDTKTTK
ncbi:MFS transporter [Hyperthermus butylicus]|uniref:Permease n=1 Tax=Hyperthermus butylicus (strain DSM 5456 / JCM 9403 / PLM1-5) TaxID=415426 RepID=A2BLY7_HYPBU|nr:MFS transporter [Hyperthermus butylicus]ABM80998.1 putative permease [Hyperthermus butylicus DSM 5456]